MNSPSDDPSIDEAPILHVDLDAFFASVEVLDDPTLRGKPVAVGGAGKRGVVASASYEARRFGVKSAMPSVVALRLCPDLVMLPGRFDRYEEYSRMFHKIVLDLTPDIEPIGLDELFADLRSLHRLDVRPVAAAARLRSRIRDELHLRSGVGLARTKLFAKLASKRSKPTVVDGRLVEGAGVVWVSRDTEARWLAEMPVDALWGVGPATASKLRQLGLGWVRDLAKVPEATLAAHVGSAMAATLAAYAVGEDRREVEVDRKAKSLGNEQTYATSLPGVADVLARVREQASVVARALRGHDLVARTITVIVRFDDLSSLSRAQTLPFGVDDEDAISAVAEALLATLEYRQAVRLLGVHASNFLAPSENQVQLSFGLEEGSDVRKNAAALSRDAQINREALREAVDEVRRRFGRTAVATAGEMRDAKVEVATQRGRAIFGPDREET